MVDVTGTQVRMARAALGWTLAELSKRADVSIPTLRAIEASETPGAISAGIAQTQNYRSGGRATAIGGVKRALEAAGVTFLRASDDGAGIRYKARRAR